MPHDIGLLSTLVISLVAAFAGGLAMRAIGLPPLIGYLMAGVAIGPFTPGIVANQKVASELAEIGVALLLFNIGLHFSFKDLLSVRKIAVPGALLQVTATALFGGLVAHLLLETTLLPSLLIGLSLSIASTAVATRILEEKRQVRALAGRIALGWLVVQDIIVILALVLFPLFAAYDTMDASHFLSSLGKTFLQVTGFVVVMLFGGRRLIPALLNYVAKKGSRELFTLSIFVMALGIAYGSAEIFGVSLALGAFFAGVVIGESDLNFHAASEALSMQQIFTILFFVSIGMLFDPSILAQAPLRIFLFLLVVLYGMGFITVLILFSLKVPLHAAVLVGSAFAQIGEFSFVLSALGYKFGFYAPQERDIIVAVAILSIILNPLVLNVSLRVAAWLGQHPRFASLLDSYIDKSGQPPEQLEEYAILIGCGRVGSLIARALKENGMRFITIESDRNQTEKLRREGLAVIYGDAAREAVLAAAKPEKAKLMLVTVPDIQYARQIIMNAKRINPDLEIIVRTHEDREAVEMSKFSNTLAIMSEKEIAFGMAEESLLRWGLPPEKARETLSLLKDEIYNKNQPVKE